MRRVGFSAAALFVPVFLMSCGGADFRMGTEWQPEESRFFDDGVDMIGDMSQLSGKWAYEQEDNLTGRAQLADLVAEVEVLSIQTKLDIQGNESKRLQVQILTRMFGEAPEETFSVTSGSDSPGYILVKRHEKRLIGRFILFVRWFQEADGTVGHHFHLSPASEEMKSAVTLRLDEREAELRTRVVK